MFEYFLIEKNHTIKIETNDNVLLVESLDNDQQLLLTYHHSSNFNLSRV